MNIQELAKQADVVHDDVVVTPFLRRFTAIVLEEAAKVCDSLQDVPATEPRHCAEDIRIEIRALKGS